MDGQLRRHIWFTTACMKDQRADAHSPIFNTGDHDDMQDPARRATRSSSRRGSLAASSSSAAAVANTRRGSNTWDEESQKGQLNVTFNVDSDSAVSREADNDGKSNSNHNHTSAYSSSCSSSSGLAISLDKFNEPTRHFQDRQRVLLSVLADARKRHLQQLAVKGKVAEIIATRKMEREAEAELREREAEAGRLERSASEIAHEERMKALAAKNRNNNNSSSSSSTNNAYSTLTSRRGSVAGVAAAAKHRLLGQSDLSVPPAQLLYQALGDATRDDERDDSPQTKLMKMELRCSYGCASSANALFMGSNATTSATAASERRRSSAHQLHQDDEIAAFFSASGTLGAAGAGASAGGGAGMMRAEPSLRTASLSNVSMGGLLSAQHHKDNQQALAARRLRGEAAEALYAHKQQGGRSALPPLEVLLKEQRAMENHATLFGAKSATTTGHAAVVPILKQHDPTMLTKNQRVLDLLKSCAMDLDADMLGLSADCDEKNSGH